MTSTEHIAKVLKDLVKQVPSIKILYEYQKGTDTHIVEVKPSNMLEDQVLKAREEKITFEFIQLFPWENIFFVTADSYTRIQKVEQEFVGTSFVDKNKIYLPDTILESTGYALAEIQAIYSTDKIEVFAYADSLKSNRVTNDAQIGLVESTLIVKDLAKALKGFSATKRGFSASKIDSAGESNYAMAA